MLQTDMIYKKANEIQTFAFFLCAFVVKKDRRRKSEEYWNADKADPFRETQI